MEEEEAEELDEQEEAEEETEELDEQEDAEEEAEAVAEFEADALDEAEVRPNAVSKKRKAKELLNTAATHAVERRTFKVAEVAKRATRNGLLHGPPAFIQQEKVPMLLIRSGYNEGRQTHENVFLTEDGGLAFLKDADICYPSTSFSINQKLLERFYLSVCEVVESEQDEVQKEKKKVAKLKKQVQQLTRRLEEANSNKRK